MRKSILFLLLSFSITAINAQFQGGKGDGYAGLEVDFELTNVIQNSNLSKMDVFDIKRGDVLDLTFAIEPQLVDIQGKFQHLKLDNGYILSDQMAFGSYFLIYQEFGIVRSIRINVLP